MRIDHVHQYTEHHRFYTFRDFSLSVLDFKVISQIYQPMVGAVAAGLYQLLYHQVPESRTGYSQLEPQRKLFLSLGLEMNDTGRRKLADEASKLEAVGLLQSSRLHIPGSEDVLYEYELLQPLSPSEFFLNQHLTLFLRDKIGKYAVIALREQFYSPEPDELAEAELGKENISLRFDELFRLNAHVIDGELEQALTEVAPARQAAMPAIPAAASAGIRYGEIIMRFPRNSANRQFVERLRSDEDKLAMVNYVAYKYELNAADMSRLLDEDGIFSSSGSLMFDELQQKASQMYRQDRKREEERRVAASRSGYAPGQGEAAGQDAPEEHGVTEEFHLPVPEQLSGRCDIPQYNMLMRNEPYTRFLQRFFPGAVPEWIDRLFERIDLSYKLPGAVINVLIHYVIGTNESQRVTKTFIEAVVSNMLVKQIDTYEKAVVYVREQGRIELRKKQEAETGSAGPAPARTYGGARGNGNRGSRKPAIPIVEKRTTGQKLSQEELEEIRRLAKELDGQG
ncbi:helicase DnaB [Paenibacillus sambharensis]|uniref:Helicase DnaB n=1 Tax=Paenibacillus sambharensis TaxID=1803190 RepID=A0A2W1LIG7_9BACL|nr:helicase DnaB [Paenibacillus sambharensis]PZD94344.1 helicase DnaB [Paenibacillus sambharensis]